MRVPLFLARQARKHDLPMKRTCGSSGRMHSYLLLSARSFCRLGNRLLRFLFVEEGLACSADHLVHFFSFPQFGRLFKG